MRQSRALKTWMWRYATVVMLLLGTVRLAGAQGQPVARIITVTNTSDSGAGSLRAAIASAADGYVINFNLPIPATITLSSPLTIGASITIAGPGNEDSPAVIISGGNSVGVFIVNAGATVAISGVTIANGNSLLGGGIFNDGTLTLTNCLIADNTGQLGGGIFNAGTLTLATSQLGNNWVDPTGEIGQGGGIYNYMGTVTLTNDNISGNNAGIEFATGGSGGAIYNYLGTVNLANTLLWDNTATTSGGGIFNRGPVVIDPPATGTGDPPAAATLILSDTTLLQNICSYTGYEAPGDCIGGGGIYNEAGTLMVTNSTIYDNFSLSLAVSVGGGAIVNDSGTASLSFVTLSDNYATWGVPTTPGMPGPNPATGGIVDSGVGGTLTIKNSILANPDNSSHSSGNCLVTADLIANSDGYNLSDDASCATFLTQTGDLNSTPAGLDPAGLTNNGGLTSTVALLPTSVAVNAIPVSSCTDVNGNPVTTDQRGVPRPQGTGCDMGAFELELSGTVPASENGCNGIFNGTFVGNLTVSNGQSCTFIAGGVNGNVTQSGGSLTLFNATVLGNVQANGGTRSIGPSTTVKGSLQIQNVPSSSAQDSICGLTLQGSLQFQNNGIALVAGSPAPPSPAAPPSSPSPSPLPTCLGNMIQGNLQVSNNTGTVQIYGNTIRGQLQVTSDSQPTQIDNNSVAGNLQVQNDGGPTAIFSNTVKGNLQCGGNNSVTLTGGGNTAAQKQGQCATF